jgi:ceramide glucosyltransferase
MWQLIHSLPMIVAWAAAALSAIGLIQATVGVVLVRAFTSRRLLEPKAPPPPISVLKPLHGDETLLADALASACMQQYPAWQVVFGVQDAADPAMAVIRRLQARFPDHDLTVVVDPTLHGANRKVGNLINMLPAAKHGVLVIADSDVHAAADWLRRLAAALEQPGVGLVTTVYTGLAADTLHLVAALGAMQINHYFLPGALLARALGRQDCLGATMMLRRETLERIGGFEALADHLADDNVLGRLVQGLGLRVALADTVPATTVAEATLRSLWRHELRWARTIRALEPVPFAASVLQYPLVWAVLAILASGGAAWSLAWLIAAWALRSAAARWAEAGLGLANRAPLWLLPVRELMSVAVMAASFAGRRVEWRGHTMQAEGFSPR